MPTLTVIAGPNGAGKSTARLRIRPAGEVINTDDFARRINATRPELASLAAGRQVLVRIAELIATTADFNFETTLSSNHSVAVMRQARAAGYRVELAYIVLRSRELHIVRVKQRVAQGGHDISRGTIVRRYDRSLDNLAAAVRIAHQTVIYDNTEPELRTLIHKDENAILLSTLPQWRRLDPTLADAIAAALRINPDTK